MAEIRKDAEDRILESMFASTPIADEGFSRQVLGRIRRQMWVRRLALPIAVLVGGAIAVKPAMQLSVAATKLLSVISQGLFELPASVLPEVEVGVLGTTFSQSLVLGAMLLAAAVLGSRLLQE